MVWMIIGLLLVMFALYRLYFLLKPLLVLSNALIKDGTIKDVSSYTYEIEQLRLELLTMNDAYYNEMSSMEKRIEFLENQRSDSPEFAKVFQQKTESVHADRNRRPARIEPASKTLTPASQSTSDENRHAKVMHPLFDRVRGLYRLGYKEADIAKELGIGISEVRLLIKRIEES